MEFITLGGICVSETHLVNFGNASLKTNFESSPDIFNDVKISALGRPQQSVNIIVRFPFSGSCLADTWQGAISLQGKSMV
jgi:hypothetical protein